MYNNINISMIEFCYKVTKWIKKMAIHTHNENVKSYQELYQCGLASAYYEVYTLIQMQAEAFLIPLSILGLKDIKEKDLLSLTMLTESEDKVIKFIPDKYTKSVIEWMSDNIYLIREDAIKSKQIADDKLNTSQDEGDHKYYKGNLMGYFEIITFMQKQAKKLGLSLKNMNLDNVNPDKDLII